MKSDSENESEIVTRLIKSERHSTSVYTPTGIRSDSTPITRERRRAEMCLHVAYDTLRDTDLIPSPPPLPSRVVHGPAPEFIRLTDASFVEFESPLIRGYTRDPLISQARGGLSGVFQPAVDRASLWQHEDRRTGGDNLMISVNSRGPGVVTRRANATSRIR